MVFSAAAEDKTLSRRMATEKPHPLHNFSMPVLKWGNQRLLRCMKQTPGGDDVRGCQTYKSSPSDSGSGRGNLRSLSDVWKRSTSPYSEKLRKLPPMRPPMEPSDARIEENRAKMVDDLHTAADQMRYTLPEEKDRESTCPWNLRTRRPVAKASVAEASDAGGLPPVAVSTESCRRSRLRCSLAPAAASDAQIGGKKEKTKFSIALSREEIEEDYYAMTGSKAPRRPKKRARTIQRQLDCVFPGLWLSEITADSYKVDEASENGKR